jgi:shikimate 5-dehydrogenase
MSSETHDHIVTKAVPTFYFIGVTTGKSSINHVFPLWTKELGRPDVVLEGIDCKLNDDPENYRRAVAQIKYDENSLGGLVTAHKINLLAAARDMFDYLDPYAEITGEISSISKRNGRLEGHAKDPITGGLSLDAITGKGYYARTNGEILCFGAGGSAVAISLHLMNKPDAADRPRRIVIVNRSQARLDHLRAMVETQDTDITFEYIHNEDARQNDALMAAMPACSLIINATGMGKDIPGSPITDAGLFPLDSIAWELNYRGELDFMHQALRQRDSRGVKVEDGWVYFVHGWSQVIAQVYHLDIDDAMFNRLSQLALSVRK